MENVKKCKNFLSTLIKLASSGKQSTETAANVKELVQNLLVRAHTPAPSLECSTWLLAGVAAAVVWAPLPLSGHSDPWLLGASHLDSSPSISFSMSVTWCAGHTGVM